MKPFTALRAHQTNGATTARLETIQLEDLTAGEVVVEVHYSSVNYKDALACTGRGRILKQHPLTPGIDAAGLVLKSSDSRFKPGEPVVITGCGIGENFDGGYSEILQVKADSVVPLPKGLTLKETMILGTAGFTAALALYRMLQNGQRPELGPIVVTGASGGVGSFATQIFSQLGFEVIAVSGKPKQHEFLKSLGAHIVQTPAQLELGTRPLETVRFGGAVDNVGGKTLSAILAHTQLWGNVASIGLAEGPELNATVMPFILRGVSLLGTSSNNTPMDVRLQIWKKLANEWKPKKLSELVTKTVTLHELPSVFDSFFDRTVHGRVLVQIKAKETVQ
jgi:acrylyl-CoA reductase (NADPH)